MIATILAAFAAMGPVFQQQPTQLTAKLVTSGLLTPLYVTAPPLDTQRLFVLEQLPARVRIVKNGTLLPTPFLGIKPICQTGGEQGLLGMAFHPNYASNGYFYLAYTDLAGATVVARYQRSAADPDLADPTSGKILLTAPQPFPNHNGGMLEFGADGYLYIGLGDGGSGNDPQNNAQNLGNYLGKILRIDVNVPNTAVPPYAIPPGNPFAGVAGAKPEIWSYGLRNPWRFDIDRQTGDMWIADVGQDWVEEVDFEPFGAAGGRNYGWRCLEGNVPTGLSGCSSVPPTPPIYQYLHSQLPGCAIIGGHVYRGLNIPDLRGTYFFSEWCQATVFSFEYENGAVQNFKNRTNEVVPPGSGVYAIASFGEDGIGELYYCVWGLGQIYKIEEAVPQVQGVTYFGTGTPGCSGTMEIYANSSPVILNPIFELRVRNAPPLSLGLMLFTDAGNTAGYDPLGLGLTFHLDLAQSTWITAADQFSGPGGASILPMPIGNIPSLVGKIYYAQSFWDWSAAGICTLPGPTNLSSSTAVKLEILN